jgi:hypothetical protein
LARWHCARAGRRRRWRGGGIGGRGAGRGGGFSFASASQCACSSGARAYHCCEIVLLTLAWRCFFPGAFTAREGESTEDGPEAIEDGAETDAEEAGEEESESARSSQHLRWNRRNVVGALGVVTPFRTALVWAAGCTSRFPTEGDVGAEAGETVRVKAKSGGGCGIHRCGKKWTMSGLTRRSLMLTKQAPASQGRTASWMERSRDCQRDCALSRM